MKALGSMVGTFWLLSPLFMGAFRLLGWAPFDELHWGWITFTWWYSILVIITAALWKLSTAELNTEEPKTKPENKNLH